jgi:hypothetical protein
MFPRLLAALCALLAAPAAAGEFVPGGNGGALARAFALPALGEYRVPARGRADTRTTLDFTNEYVREGRSCADECITLDGETARLRLTHRRGLGGGWDFSLDVPVLSTGGGFLDAWIQDWHDWFGLPTGGREGAANGQYRYEYSQGGVARMNVTEHGTCLGDVSLGLGRRLGAGLALRGMVKAPTGDAVPLCGGNTGSALWLDAGAALGARGAVFAAAGVSVNEAAEPLAALQHRTVPFGGLGVLLPVTNDIRLLAQVYGHRRLYHDSNLEPLSRPGLPLTLGLNIRTGANSFVDLGFQEDASVNASADFAAYLSLRYGP